MPEALAPSPARTTTLFKQCNITIVADGLQTSVLDAQLFPELGATKKVLQLPSLALLEYEGISFWAEPENRRAVVLDNTGRLSATTPITRLMDRYLAKVPGVNVMALGLNFFFELVFEEPSVNLMLHRFLQRDAMVKLGGEPASAGFKVSHEAKGYLRQMSVDPLWKNGKGVSVLINYHLDSPVTPGRGLQLQERFTDCMGDAPLLVAEIANA